MSRFLIVSTQDNEERTVTNNYNTWGEMIEGEGLGNLVSGKKAVLRETKETLSNSTRLPGGSTQYTIFLHTQKVKAGYDKGLKEFYDQIVEVKNR